MSDDPKADGGKPAPTSGMAVGGLAARAFWITLIVLAAVTILLVLLASRAPVPPQTGLDPEPARIEVNLPSTAIQTYVERAARVANEKTEAILDSQLDYLFDPVAGAVHDYAEFHFSVLGEYAELLVAAAGGGRSLWQRFIDWRDGEAQVVLDAETQAEVDKLAEQAEGRIENAIQQRLYAGFDTRREQVERVLNSTFVTMFEREFQRLSSEGLAALGGGAMISGATRTALDGALARARVSKPIAMTVAVVSSAALTKFLAAALTKTALKSGAKLGGKALASGAGLAGGAATGAAIGTTLGPIGSAVGGVTGAVAAWISVDYAAIKIDEYLNRDEFEAGLYAHIAVQRKDFASALKAAIDLRELNVVGMTLKERAP